MDVVIEFMGTIGVVYIILVRAILAFPKKEKCNNSINFRKQCGYFIKTHISVAAYIPT
jgi:hypothetical protein